MIEGIIYKYTSPSGRHYIGQTTNEKVRREHWNTEGPYAGRKIDRARKKYGIKNFSYEVLERRIYESAKDARSGLDALEVYYIGLYDSYRNGYNCTIGGNTCLGYIPTNKTRNKISKAHLGKVVLQQTRDKLSKARKGKKFTQEWTDNISRSLKGRRCTWGDKISLSKPKKVVIQYNTDGVFINEYPSVKDASNKTNISMTALYKCLSGRNNTAGGFIWKYKN